MKYSMAELNGKRWNRFLKVTNRFRKSKAGMAQKAQEAKEPNKEKSDKPQS